MGYHIMSDKYLKASRLIMLIEQVRQEAQAGAYDVNTALSLVRYGILTGDAEAVIPVARGTWKSEHPKDYIECSLCGGQLPLMDEPKFCPHCGARMNAYVE